MEGQRYAAAIGVPIPPMAAPLAGKEKTIGQQGVVESPSGE
jgi:hypothetical protein